VGPINYEGVPEWASLESQWIKTDEQGNSDSHYQRLLTGFAECVRTADYEGTTPVTFLLGIDRLIQAPQQAGRPISELQDISLRAGKAYARCYRVANAYRQKIRLDARRQFMLRHWQDIRLAQQQLLVTVARLSKESRVAYKAT